MHRGDSIQASVEHRSGSAEPHPFAQLKSQSKMPATIVRLFGISGPLAKDIPEANRHIRDHSGRRPSGTANNIEKHPHQSSVWKCRHGHLSSSNPASLRRSKDGKRSSWQALAGCHRPVRPHQASTFLATARPGRRARTSSDSFSAVMTIASTLALLDVSWRSAYRLRRTQSASIQMECM
jgi:hypothetical protein